MLTRANGPDPSSAHRRCVPRDIMSAESAHRRSTDSADADSGQITRGEYRQTSTQRKIALPSRSSVYPFQGGLETGSLSKRAIGGRCGSIGASCRCSRTPRRRLLCSDAGSARAERHTCAESVPLAEGLSEHGQPLQVVRGARMYTLRAPIASTCRDDDPTRGRYATAAKKAVGRPELLAWPEASVKEVPLSVHHAGLVSEQRWASRCGVDLRLWEDVGLVHASFSARARLIRVSALYESSLRVGAWKY